MDLVSRCLKDEPRAWDELIALTRRSYLGILVRVLGPAHRSAAPDLEQELLLRLLVKERRALEPLRGAPERELRIFVGTIALNLARDHLRRQETRTTALGRFGTELHPASAPDPEDLAARRERIEQIRAAVVEDGNERELRLFDGYYLEGKTASELAGGGELSAKGVESVIHRLTVRLRKRFRGTE